MSQLARLTVSGAMPYRVTKAFIPPPAGLRQTNPAWAGLSKYAPHPMRATSSSYRHEPAKVAGRIIRNITPGKRPAAGVSINEETRRPVDNPVEKVIHAGSIVGLANHTVLAISAAQTLPL